MLKNAAIVPYIPVSNVTRAREFYEKKVGLQPKEEYAGGVVYECGDGSWVFMYPSPKWHLGQLPQFLPMQHGFDSCTLTKRYTEEAVRFIAEHRTRPTSRRSAPFTALTSGSGAFALRRTARRRVLTAVVADFLTGFRAAFFFAMRPSLWWPDGPMLTRRDHGRGSARWKSIGSKIVLAVEQRPHGG